MSLKQHKRRDSLIRYNKSQTENDLFFGDLIIEQYVVKRIKTQMTLILVSFSRPSDFSMGMWVELNHSIPVYEFHISTSQVVFVHQVPYTARIIDVKHGCYRQA